MPGSLRAAPGEAESSGPQEVLKPPHTLEIPAGQQRRRRERVSGLARTGQGACSVAGGDRCYPSTCLFPTEGPRLGRQATKQERAQQGQKARTQVLVTKGSCTPGHHQDRPQHLRAGRPPSPQPHPSPPARVGERRAALREATSSVQSRAGLLAPPSGPDPSVWGGSPGGPTTASTRTTPHTRQMNGLHGVGEACDEDEMVCEGSGQCWLTGEVRSYQLTLCKEAC